MTAQFLQNELANLVQEAKRKNSDLRHAAETSLRDLKSLGPSMEATVELSNRPGFLSPFLIACGTRNAKFSTIGVVCLQRLIVSRALAKSRLKEVLEAFREASHLGVDIQLKILQALPPLLQNYPEDLHGALLSEALHICAILQGSKMGVVNNTAAATLSQIVISIFDKVVVEDEKAVQVPAIGEAPSESGNVLVRPAALDAYRVFHDLCLLTEGHKPMFLRFGNLPQPFGLELIESVLTNHPEIFLSHPEQAHVLRTRVAPLVMRSLSDRLNFPTTVRITRVLYILLRRHLSILPAECEISLSLLTHLLEPDASQPWKRALCMEVLRGLCAEAALIRKIFSQYDAKEGAKPIVRDLMGAMTRLATEKPNVIGLGTQSSVPIGEQTKDVSSEQAALEAGGVAGIIGGAVGLGDVPVTGLSTQWSLMRVPCIDQLDKSEPPLMPESYIYCLTLTCINSFSEGLARFILPLASNDKRTRVSSIGISRTISDSEVGSTLSVRPDTPDGRTSSPVKQVVRRKTSMRQPKIVPNLLAAKSHPSYGDIAISSALIDACWPAVLAACSTFLYATLDNDLYHGLVRAFQKFAHVAGILRLATPRDAFLTTLGKAAVPSNVLSANISSPMTPTTSDSLISNARGLLGVDSPVSGSERLSGAGDHSSVAPSLNSRNLLCLRALLNLGIALGPTLDRSWTIVLETLQQADYVLFASSRRGGRQLSLSGSAARTDSTRLSDSSLMSNIGAELVAVEAAAGKLLESTKDFSDDAFASILTSLCKLLDVREDKANARTSFDSQSSQTLPPTSPSGPPRRRLANVSSLSIASQIIGDNAFTLAKMGELAQINMMRLVGPHPDESGWNLLIHHLVSVCGSRDMGNSIRFKAAEVLNETVTSAAKCITPDNTEDVGEVQRRILVALKAAIGNGHQAGAADSATRSTELEIHRAGLEALNAILEHAGQSLIAGWEIVFDIIASVFDSSMVWRRDSGLLPISESVQVELSTKFAKSTRLIKSSFGSLELICSDFLSSLPTSCMLVLIDALFAFCSQKDDLNISLTTITFFWNVSDFLQTRGSESEQEDSSTAKVECEQDLLDLIVRTDFNSHSALWMLLLLRLTGVSRDHRAEVRNGSIQTLFRIFDTYGHQLGPQGWTSCLRIVVFKMMSINPNDQTTNLSNETSDRLQWDETIQLTLGGIGTLYSNYFEAFTQQENFQETWSVFMRYLDTLLIRKSPGVSSTVFSILSRVLARIGAPDNLAPESRQEVWSLWSSQGIKQVDGFDNTGNSIQETLIAYIECYKSLYRLLQPTLTAEIVRKTLDILRECILFPDSPPYFQDTEILTPLQATVLEVIKLIRTDIPEVPSLVVKHLSQFNTVAYSQPGVHSSAKGKRIPTYIALSVQSISLLENVAAKHINDPEIYTSSALVIALEGLEVPIGLKYGYSQTCITKMKRTNLWNHPTQAILSIAGRALPSMNKLGIPKEIRQRIWKTIVKIMGSVLRADDNIYVDEDTLRKDETLDIESFRELRSLIIPALGQPVVPDDTVLQYVEAVFWGSMLYHVPGAPLKPENFLQVSHRGSTSDLVLERRGKMAYVCIDELFSLTTGGEKDSPELQRLAKAAAPWLIWRVGLVLCRYISDHPLRGRMPQPASQRKEMLYLLDKFVWLKSGQQTIQIDSPQIPPSSKRHLFKLFPLFSRCVGIAQSDPELLGLLSKALGEMGESLWLKA